MGDWNVKSGNYSHVAWPNTIGHLAMNQQMKEYKYCANLQININCY